MASKEITSGEKIIDSRDVIARLKDLERWKPDGWKPEIDRDEESPDWDEGEEYEKLKPFADATQWALIFGPMARRSRTGRATGNRIARAVML
ncbi:MAG: hypothetical protein ACKO0Z_06860 [Betaproteobacteria bacterium]